MPPSILSMLKNVFFRGALLYLVLAVAVVVLVDFKSIQGRAGPATLSRLKPHYKFLVQFADGQSHYPLKTLTDQKVYQEGITAIMGVRPDAMVFLAYTNYHLGRKKAAGELFQKSLELNPTFFWTYYNLGIIAFESGDEKQAWDYLASSLQVDPQLTLKFMLSSRVFLPLLSEGKYMPEKFLHNLQLGQLNALKLMVVTGHRLARYKDILSLIDKGLRASPDPRDQAFFLYYGGLAAMHLNNGPAALKYLEECLARDSEHPEALSALASLARAAGQKEMAESLGHKAARLSAQGLSRLPKAGDFAVRIF